jgi:hypothetical protein
MIKLLAIDVVIGSAVLVILNEMVSIELIVVEIVFRIDDA